MRAIKLTLTADNFGRFNDGDSYIIVHTEQNGLSQVYSWSGTYSSADERTAVSMLSSTLMSHCRGGYVHGSVVM